MHIKETNIDDRLDILEKMDNWEFFIFDSKTSRTRFHNVTVAKLMRNKEIPHALLIFEKSVSRSRAVRIAKKIGRTLEALNREISIEVFFEVHRDLFDMIRSLPDK